MVPWGMVPPPAPLPPWLVRMDRTLYLRTAEYPQFVRFRRNRTGRETLRSMGLDVVLLETGEVLWDGPGRCRPGFGDI